MIKRVHIILDKTKKDIARIDLKLFYDRWSIYTKRGEFLKLDASAPRIINIESEYYCISKLWQCCKKGHGSLQRFINELEYPKNITRPNEDVYIYYFKWV